MTLDFQLHSQMIFFLFMKGSNLRIEFFTFYFFYHFLFTEDQKLCSTSFSELNIQKLQWDEVIMNRLTNFKRKK